MKCVITLNCAVGTAENYHNMRTYISGKISGLPFDEVVSRFNEAEELLASIGIEPVNPLKNGLSSSDKWERHMVRDIELLMGCDSILMLENWTDSKGARIEKYIAEEQNLLVQFESTIIKHNTRVQRIQEAIHEVMGLRFEDYTTKSRLRTFYFARIIFVNHCRKCENMTLAEIARLVCRDHTTLHHYINNFKDEIRYNPEFRELSERVDKIMNKSASLRYTK